MQGEISRLKGRHQTCSWLFRVRRRLVRVAKTTYGNGTCHVTRDLATEAIREYQQVLCRRDPYPKCAVLLRRSLAPNLIPGDIVINND